MTRMSSPNPEVARSLDSRVERSPDSGVERAAAEVRRARGHEPELRQVFDRSRVPMVMLDGQRRYLDANVPARLILRMGIDELRRHAVDDLTPPETVPTLDEQWEEFLDAGSVAGSWDMEALDGSRYQIAYHAMAHALPGVHVGVFAPAEWPDDELSRPNNSGAGTRPKLSPRELEVLSLASRGMSGPQIAAELVLSRATVKSHFANIHDKLGVRNRAAAVAKAIQLGLID